LLQATTRKRKGNERYTQSHNSQVGYISAIWGADPVGSIFAKKWQCCKGSKRNHSLQFWSQYFFWGGVQTYKGSTFHFPIDFAGHRYNYHAAATAQPVIMVPIVSIYCIDAVTMYAPYHVIISRHSNGVYRLDVHTIFNTAIIDL